MNLRSVWAKRTGLVVSGVVGTGLLAMTTVVSLGGFTASITNPTNTLSSGTVVLKEVAGATTCDSTGGTGGGGSITATNSANCTTIDLLGAPANQGPASAATSQLVTLTNVGTIAGATFTVTPAACSAIANAATAPYVGADTAGFCGKVDVTVEDDTGAAKCLYPASAGACPALSNTYTLSTLGVSPAISLGALAAAGSKKVTFKTQLDAAATNADQGLQGKLAFTWTLNQ